MGVTSLTPFFNELDVLEIRLATLDNVVDMHVIAEATVTHTGLPKPLYFANNLERFRPWLHKIVYVCVDDMPEGTWAIESWAREKHQRQALLKGVGDLDESERFLLSDVDEIPHPSAVLHAGDGEHLRCNMHVGRLNWRWPGEAEDSYTISRVFSGKTLRENDYDLEAVRLQPWSSRPDARVGWHLSYMGDIPEKLRGFVHQELTPEATPERVEAALSCGDDLFGRDRGCEWVDVDVLPPYVAANRQRFAPLLVDQP